MEQIRNFINKYRTDLSLVIIVLITFLSWVKVLNPMVFLVIYLYLLIRRKDVSWFLIVNLFSIFTYRADSFFIADVFLTLILFILTVVKIIREGNKVRGKLSLILLIYGLYAFISIFYSVDPLWSLFGFFTLLPGFLAYFILINGKLNVTKAHILHLSKVATYLLFTVTLELLYHYLTNDYQTIISTKYINLGWGVSNYIGAFYVLLLPIAWYKYTSTYKNVILYFILDIVNVFALVMTMSRGAYLGLLVGVAVFLFFNIRIFRHIKRYALIGGSTLVLLMMIPFTNKLIVRLISKFPLSLGDNNGRFELWHTAMDLFLERPLFGHGYHTAFYYITKLGREEHFFHNFIVEIMATLGGVGLILLIILLVKFVFMLYKPKDPFLMSVLAGIVGFLTHCFFDTMFNLWSFGILMYTIMGAVELYRKSIDQNK